ncbi:MULTISPECIES: 3-carboxyethylcatechol 2,3-dioxygenase [unclassified Streptomyces]|uniref:3-carboxyethylcatechol 2,3-dioxygenase n=1 Tax=unclassified Streptomyces TaxID=2593676 RepID=UPI001660E724|nr:MULTISPECIES: 3-carboxyethylcatechol 2,3-dioxygenase [unclassified Streptomyces]MBD0711834.1 3-(2,3-dihydroxyphenyl)propionate dioxygenase [Streptomyces sp. CBMA291]MBD0714654.1 3-(2,3-dihydroxyphenyl)propionate dioxygenase [Streptomyces sp. CBMA370]
MSLALVTMSHSPLLDFAEPPPEVTEAVETAFDQARTFVREYEPTLVVSFAPDHYNGFFHDLMPPFCVGYAAVGVGDYGTAEGPLDVPEERAGELAQWLAEHDLDIAISRRMEVDHGAVQPLEILFGGVDAVPVVPVFVNGVARPFVPMRRVRRLGEAIGSYLAGLENERVLLLGSGGLSHDPPVPQWATADAPTRAMLLNGRHPTAAARELRQRRVIDTARDFAAGTATIRDLNPEWDRALMDVLASGDLSPVDAMDPARMAVEAGNSSHEVRTWVAAFAALGAAGPYEVASSFYRPVKEYIAGFGVMTARSTG